MEVRQRLRGLPEDAGDAQRVRVLLTHPRVQLPVRIEGHLQVQCVGGGVLEDGGELHNVRVPHAPQERGLAVAHAQHGGRHCELLHHEGLSQLVRDAVHAVLRADRQELLLREHVQRALGHPEGQEVLGQALPELRRDLREDVPHAGERGRGAPQLAVRRPRRRGRRLDVGLDVLRVLTALQLALQRARRVFVGLLRLHAGRLLCLEIAEQWAEAVAFLQGQLRVPQLRGVLADDPVHPGQQRHLRLDALKVRASRGQQLPRAPERLVGERRPERLLAGNGAGGRPQLRRHGLDGGRGGARQKRGLRNCSPCVLDGGVGSGYGIAPLAQPLPAAQRLQCSLNRAFVLGLAAALLDRAATRRAILPTLVAAWSAVLGAPQRGGAGCGALHGPPEM
mmetsp:Transcript_77521/g.240128  ORF Transcript_77521/g.240128 Transcript_77521/m.240128 type:complete len:394 (+) Transcript_77521:1303-2484(+)